MFITGFKSNRLNPKVAMWGTIASIVASLAPSPLQAKTLKACTVHWPPYITVTGSGEIGGPITATLCKIATNLGYEVDIQEVPWKRCLQMVKRGEIDIAYSASYHSDRAKYMHYPKQALHATSYVFATCKGAEHEWDEDKNLLALPQPVGSVLGYSVTDELKQVEGLDVDDGATTDHQNVQKMLKGRTECILIDPQVLEAILVQIDQTEKVQILSPPHKEGKEYYIAISKLALGNLQAAHQLLLDFESELSKLGEQDNG